MGSEAGQVLGSPPVKLAQSFAAALLPRSLHDALGVLSQAAKEMPMSCAVEEAAQKAEGKKAIAIHPR
ncbi:hypothetical protein FRC08_009022 [Ceratobasidium sp. 394]|nr:hypothetical protein FRC08_009022 [Ceratobasidium sp. 394]